MLTVHPKNIAADWVHLVYSFEERGVDWLSHWTLQIQVSYGSALVLRFIQNQVAGGVDWVGHVDLVKILFLFSIGFDFLIFEDNRREVIRCVRLRFVRWTQLERPLWQGLSEALFFLIWIQMSQKLLQFILCLNRFRLSIRIVSVVFVCRTGSYRRITTHQLRNIFRWLPGLNTFLKPLKILLRNGHGRALALQALRILLIVVNSRPRLPHDLSWALAQNMSLGAKFLTLKIIFINSSFLAHYEGIVLALI